MSYLQNVPTSKTARQGDILPGQVPSSDGSGIWATDDFMRLRRFLILGSQGGSYYAGEHNLTMENVDAVQACMAKDGIAVVDMVKEISTSGVAIKNDPAIFVLAMCCAATDLYTRQHAFANIPAICRTGTHLMQFATFVDARRGWGRGLKKGVAAWYERENIDSLALQVTKYRQRDGWTHQDLLRTVHPVAPTDAHRQLYGWLSGNAGHETLTVDGRRVSKTGAVKTWTYDRPVTKFDGEVENKWIDAYLELQTAPNEKAAAKIIRETGAPREFVQTDHLASVEVWDALLPSMPMMAMVRNLGVMTSNGLLTPGSDATKLVLEKMGDDEALTKSRIHPFSLLLAQDTYQSGHGFRGKKTWIPVGPVIDALDKAFYKAFKNVETTNLRWLLALDISGSMGWGSIAGSNITPHKGTAAMSLVTAATEPMYHIVGFSNDLVDLALTPRMRLDAAMRELEKYPMGSTDCSLPMEWAIKNKREVDVFVVYTDSETNHWGSRQPAIALRDYRQKMGIDAKLIVVGMVANNFTIADPNDRGMLDVVGFDGSAPQVMSQFARGLV